MMYQTPRFFEPFLGRFVRSYSSSSAPLRVCVVGSGPAGFYTAHQLIKKHPETRVDILERLPVPFGLVRFGVAPDHPEVKNCINQFTTLAQSNNCRFIGNVCVGSDITVNTVKCLYHAVVLAYGAEGDRELGIPGEDLHGVYSARNFVGWYNGLPSCRDLSPDLSGETAVVFGHGNVALDVARMLLTPVDMLKTTDICQHALEVLAESKIQRVTLIGRRGPLQVAFTIKELREMTRLPDLPRPRKRLTELMIQTADEPATPSEESLREWGLQFLRSPVELVPTEEGKVGGVRLEINRLEGEWDSAKALGTGEFEELGCSMVLRSIGYKALPLEGETQFDLRRGFIPSEKGRIGNGVYCSGWVKTGPVGVIVTTMNNAFETAETILEDYDNGLLNCDEDGDLLDKLKGVSPVLFSDWERIDEEEVESGRLVGKPREKITSIQTMLDLAHRYR